MIKINKKSFLTFQKFKLIPRFKKLRTKIDFKLNFFQMKKYLKEKKNLH